ncbi:transposase [Thermobifida halotolerans]|uniref:Transposase n=2 Tax=Thermobifida halotolerans TaxID=483545 RepID=A0AA97M0L2_9ACTN|nr:transposase [Thermobifida halotolerans]
MASPPPSTCASTGSAAPALRANAAPSPNRSTDSPAPTPHHHQTLEAVALWLVGRPGARLARTLCAPTSPNSLIRILHALPDEPPTSVSRLLGADDFALKRGHVHATILLDMETGRRIDVLPDRTADPFAAWLRDHPGVEIVCRDRASAYAEAAHSAVPGAVQVADRFHLWKNLCEAVDKCVAAHRGCLAEPASEPAQTDTEPTPTPAAIEGSGCSQAETTCCGPRPAGQGDRVSRRSPMPWVSTAGPSAATRTPRPRRTCPPATDAGPPSSTPTRPTRTSGGTRDTRTRSGCARRSASGATRAANTPGDLEPLRTSGRPAPPVPEALTVRQATGPITSPPSRLKPEEEVRLKELLSRCPQLEQVAKCVRSFATMMREKEEAGPEDVAGQRRGDREAADAEPHPRAAPGLRRGDHRTHPGMELRPCGRQRVPDQGAQKGPGTAVPDSSCRAAASSTHRDRTRRPHTDWIRAIPGGR